jgi:hypothetical protein
LQDGEGEGELGCSDIPGWEDGRLELAIKATEKASASSKSGPAAVSPKGAETDELAKDPAGSRDGAQKRQAKPQPKRVDDGTDDYLHQPLREARSSYSEGSTASGASHADIQSIQETAEITGKVVLLSRGGCGFVEKVRWAQRRGAIALIVGDNVKGGPLIQMFARDNADNVTIPSVFTSRTTAHLLSSLMQPGSYIDDVLGGYGDPKLKAQRSVKTGRKKLAQRSSASARYDPKTAPEGSEPKPKESRAARRSWLSRLFKWGDRQGVSSDSRPPSSGRLDWTRDGKNRKPIVTPSSQDSANEDVLSGSSGALARQAAKAGKAGNIPPAGSNGPKGGSVTPGSGEYVPEAAGDSVTSGGHGKSGSSSGPRRGVFAKIFGGEEEAGEQAGHAPHETQGSSTSVSPPVPSAPDWNDAREGLWVTITPTGSASPFFDTLLVLVVSPLITLTVVYALLILRVKIRMRRWRAPKSVVDRLPVRTYHTVAPSPTRSSRAPSPTSSSPTTPLLQGSSRSRPRSHTTTGVPEGDVLRADEAAQTPRAGVPSPEKNSCGGISSQWKKYMGRQVECVVCLEEYVDGVSRVMSLPCGHEFHAECM